MKRNCKSAKEWRDESLTLAESLVNQLDDICKQAREKESCPGLVELEKARKDALRLRRLVSSNKLTSSYDWERIMRSLAFLAELAKRFHSLLNCKLVLVENNDYWVDYKTIADGGQSVSDRACKATWCNKSISVSSRKQQEATRFASVA